MNCEIQAFRGLIATPLVNLCIVSIATGKEKFVVHVRLNNMKHLEEQSVLVEKGTDMFPKSTSDMNLIYKPYNPKIDKFQHDA